MRVNWPLNQAARSACTGDCVPVVWRPRAISSEPADMCSHCQAKLEDLLHAAMKADD
jgi:hypothetical protein